ncbi:DUF6268 family outer membrane beta-barrel protein [Hymenobacter sp. BT175]|uniref:DUF6268 family outer membrane beta-barrel protein n=1 Tax=Hymenobacter translucens TaxID=2886507 RepID=UPI001D0E5AA7|nr:DUF6268 family outer membrane beta-barrel protein [Hymenobacter translucens]MCC2547296.1 DUF6268 family outer membrane beta-barrel protein [Hymenobacter translucens]
MIRIRYSLSRLLPVGLLLAAAGAAQAQTDPATPRVYPAPAPTATDTTQAAENGRDKEFANPSVLGMGPSKGLIFRHERTPSFNVNSTSKAPFLGNFSSDVSKNGRFLVKGYIPFLNHPHLKMVLGINYERQEFQFKDPPTDYVPYQNIQDKGLKTLGTQLVVLRPINSKNWMIFRVKGELNGDYTSKELNFTDYLKMSSEFVYGWKKSPLFSWGLGVQVGSYYGRQSVYPALLYNRTFNNRWGVEALFPARVTFRYNPGANSTPDKFTAPKTLIYAGYEVEGLNYTIKLRKPLDEANQTPLTTLELRQTELRGRVRLEREIYDFLWFGLEAGYRYNYAFNAYDRRNNSRTEIIDTNMASTPYASIELFITPPRRFLKP